MSLSFSRWGIARAALVLGMAASVAAEPVRYELDPEHLTIAFLVEHLGYAKTLGAFRGASGAFTFDEATGEISTIRVVVNTNSVDTAHAARDRHLTSRDFLSSGEHPQMVFSAEGAERTDERSFVIVGDLELLGIRRPLTLEATLNKSAPYPIGARTDVIGVSARGRFKRSEFGMTYGVEGGLVGDDVEIIIELEARGVTGGAP
jgi:polyisoprenoid-binding protein YceI